MSVYKIKIDGLDEMQKAFFKAPRIATEELSIGVRSSLNMIRPIMRQEAPHRTGKLRRHIYVKWNGLKGEVGPNLNATPYALYVHQGTKAHEIRPKLAGALYWKGALHPVKRVQHPGTTANPFVERTVDRMQTPVNRIFKEVLKRITAKL